MYTDDTLALKIKPLLEHTFVHPKIFSYSELRLQPLPKPLLPFEKVFVKFVFFFINFPNLLTLKTSTKASFIECFPYIER